MAKPQMHKLMGLDLTLAQLEADLGIPNFGRDTPCNYKSVDAELFFSENLGDIAQAKALCETCPFKQRCLEDGIMFEEYGIRGGMTPAERKKYAKGMNPQDRAVMLIKIQNRKLLMSDLPSSQLALRWGVSERQVQRWRQALGKF